MTGNSIPPGRFIERITMDISSSCNLRCIMCPQHLSRMSSEGMPDELFSRIAREIFPHTKELFLSCAFEPLMARDFDNIIKKLPLYGIPNTLMITNATLLDSTKAELIISSGLSSMVVSVDAAREDTFRRIRRGADYAKVLENIGLMQRIKEETGTTSPDISLTCVMMKSNYGELPEMIELAARLGLKRVNFNPLQAHTQDMRKEELDEADGPLLKDIIEKAQNRADSLGIETDISGKLVYYIRGEGCGASEAKDAGRAPDARCIEPFPSFYIHPDGRIDPCTIWKLESLGNLAQQDFIDIWRGKEYRELYRELCSGDLRPCCSECCYMV